MKNVLTGTCPCGSLFIWLLITSSSLHAQDYNLIEHAVTIQHQEGWDSGPAAYTTVGATYEPPQSTCVNLPNRWFKFTATDSYIKLTVYGGTIAFIQHNLFSGNSYTLVGCGQATAGLSTYSFERTDLIPGTQYYLSIASDNNGRGTFGIKVSTVKDYNYIEGAVTIQHQNGWDPDLLPIPL